MLDEDLDARESLCRSQQTSLMQMTHSLAQGQHDVPDFLLRERSGEGEGERERHELLCDVSESQSHVHAVRFRARRSPVGTLPCLNQLEQVTPFAVLQDNEQGAPRSIPKVACHAKAQKRKRGQPSGDILPPPDTLGR